MNYFRCSFCVFVCLTIKLQTLGQRFITTFYNSLHRFVVVKKEKIGRRAPNLKFAQLQMYSASNLLFCCYATIINANGHWSKTLEAALHVHKIVIKARGHLGGTTKSSSTKSSLLSFYKALTTCMPAG